MIFRNRVHAGECLAESLEPYKNESPLVMSLVRGGVPVAFQVAKRLLAPLDILLVKKVGVPQSPELALGAMVEGEEDERLLNYDIIRSLNLKMGEVYRAVKHTKKELDHLAHEYKAFRPHLNLENRVIIVVDDGIATGTTMKAAAQRLRHLKPRKMVMGVPVSSKEAVSLLEGEVDGMVVLKTPFPFFAVGQFYDEFPQVSTKDVRDCLTMAQLWQGTRGDLLKVV